MTSTITAESPIQTVPAGDTTPRPPPGKRGRSSPDASSGDSGGLPTGRAGDRKGSGNWWTHLVTNPRSGLIRIAKLLEGWACRNAYVAPGEQGELAVWFAELGDISLIPAHNGRESAGCCSTIDMAFGENYQSTLDDRT